MKNKRLVSIIGAGIQGCLVALQLVQKGFYVNLVEQSTDIFNRASLNQEGKVHLGFMYVLDLSFNTSYKILEDGILFAPLIEDVCRQSIDWKSMMSGDFQNIVAKDSILTHHELINKYAQLQEKYKDLKNAIGHSYFSSKDDLLFKPINLNAQFNPDLIEGQISTAERAIHPPSLKNILKQEILSNDRIKLFLRHQVIDIQENTEGFELTCRMDGATKKIKSEIVVNAAWEGKRAIDQQMDLSDDDQWSTRLKFGLVMPIKDQTIPTFVMVHGAFGDYVVFKHQKEVFFSWYPDCMIEQTTDIKIPDRWEPICNGEYTTVDTKQIVDNSLQAFRQICPQSNLPDIIRLKAGTIMGRGIKTIADPKSKLHARFDSVIQQRGGYFSINTQKFTSAPNNAKKLMSFLN